MKELTKAEEQVMHILWDIGEGFVKDILEKMEEPKPAYNTVSTIVRILEKKGFVGYKAFGKSHQYHPLISQETYSRDYLDNFVGNYFEGSFSKLVSFFAREKNLSVKDMDELMKHVKDNMDDNPEKK